MANYLNPRNRSRWNFSDSLRRSFPRLLDQRVFHLVTWKEGLNCHNSAWKASRYESVTGTILSQNIRQNYRQLHTISSNDFKLNQSKLLTNARFNARLQYRRGRLGRNIRETNKCTPINRQTKKNLSSKFRCATELIVHVGMIFRCGQKHTHS